MSYIVWTKGEKKQLTPNFSTLELQCRCSNASCIEQKISEDLLARLQKVRHLADESITVTSGYRCAAHQQELRDKGYETAQGVSQHELGNAVDISAADMDILFQAARLYFMAVGKARTFIHVDTRSDKPRSWSYNS